MLKKKAKKIVTSPKKCNLDFFQNKNPRAMKMPLQIADLAIGLLGCF